MHDWYIVFCADYISGKPRSDNDENSEAVWLNIEDALSREDVPELTKKLIESAAFKQYGLRCRDYEGNAKDASYSQYLISDPDVCK